MPEAQPPRLSPTQTCTNSSGTWSRRLAAVPVGVRLDRPHPQLPSPLPRHLPARCGSRRCCCCSPCATWAGGPASPRARAGPLRLRHLLVAAGLIAALSFPIPLAFPVNSWQAPGRPLLALAAARSPLRPRLGGGGARLVGRAALRRSSAASVGWRRRPPSPYSRDGAGDRRRGPLRGSQRLGSELHPGRGTIRGRIAARRHHQAPILALSGEPAARASTPTMGRDPSALFRARRPSSSS
jgi:hypothetical protein